MFFLTSKLNLRHNDCIYFTGSLRCYRIHLGGIHDILFGTKDGGASGSPTSEHGDNNRTEEKIDDKCSANSCHKSPEITVDPKELETGQTHDGGLHGSYIPMYQSEGRFRVSVSWPSMCDRKWVTLDTHPEVVCTFDRKGPEFEFRRKSFKIQDGVTESGFYVDVSNPYGIEGSTIDFTLEDSGEVLKEISVRS